MMSCSRNLCNNFIITQAISFSDSTLTINLPSGSYNNLQRYCLVIAQEIPSTTTINANVVITIGTDTTTYPLINCDGTNVSASQLATRKIYSTVVRTNIQSGVFKLTGSICGGSCRNVAKSLPITTTTTTTT